MEKEDKNSKNETKLLNKKKSKPEKTSSAKPKKEKEKENKIKETAFYKEDNIDIDEEIKNDEKELGLQEEEIEDVNKIREKIITSSNTNKDWVNKTRTLIVASRGVSHQERHLVNDLIN